MWLMHNDAKHEYTKLQLDPNRRIKLHDRTIDRGQKKSVADKKMFLIGDLIYESCEP
jgi:hypothetical protein